MPFDIPVSDELTTAESLVLQLVIAHSLLGAECTTLANRLWIRPQLDALRDKGLLTWNFDENADFWVIPTPLLMQTDQALAMSGLEGVTHGGH